MAAEHNTALVRGNRLLVAVRDDRHTWTRVNAGLEDVFISLMDEAKDNFS